MSQTQTHLPLPEVQGSITVGNSYTSRRDADINLYCGRQSSFKGKAAAGLTNAKLGNQHTVGTICPVCNVVHPRGEAIRAYAADLAKADPAGYLCRSLRRMAERLNEGKSIKLFCFCSPEACHCDVIAREVRIRAKWLKEGGAQ